MKDSRSNNDAAHAGGRRGGEERGGHDEQRAGGPHLDEHLCLDLLHGLLPRADEDAVLDHTAECPACEQLLQVCAATSERLAAKWSLRPEPDGTLVLQRRGTATRDRAAPLSEGRGALGRLRARMRAGLALPALRLAGGLAVIALAMVLVFWPRSADRHALPPLQALPPYSFQLQSQRSAGSAPDPELIRGLEAYAAADFERAVELLTRASPPPADAVQGAVRLLYLGSALAWQGQYDEAVAALQPVPFALIPEDWSSEARWTLYVALRGAGRAGAADSLLKVLTDRPGEIGERARRQLRR